MKSIQMQLTTSCNQNCFMCRKYTWAKKEMPLNIVEKYVEKYPDATFTFSGGDPLHYSKLRELATILKTKKIMYQIFTNLNYDLTADQKEFLEDADVVQVSFDGSNESTYNSVRRPKVNGYQFVLKNIEYLFALKKQKLKLNATISCRNYFDVKNIFIFCWSKGYNIRFFPVHTDEEAKLKPYMIQYIIDSFDKSVPDRVLPLIGSRPDYLGKCFVKSEHLVIDEDGRCYPCCRAINDNGEDWDGRYTVDNLGETISDENVLYPFCKECDRYRKFNEIWDEYKDKERVYL